MDVDPSTFDPVTATEDDWARLQIWRRDMNRLAPWKPRKKSADDAAPRALP